MSSPPNPATSPTFTSGVNLNPKKRPLASIPGSSTSTSKRRKPSHAVSTTAGFSHPLRQTSFPPDEANRLPFRSPSVESSVAGSAVVGRGGKGGKRARDARSTGEGSVRNSATGRDGTENLSLADGKSGGGVIGEEEDEDEDENDAGTTMMFDRGGQADEDQEKQRLAYVDDIFYARIWLRHDLD
jgi:transcription initiation factor TFIID subunit 11